jgi:hypothetical protein
LGDCIAFLRNDRNIAPALCGIDHAYQQSFQLDERCQINAGVTKTHPGADQGIEHPRSHRDHDAGGPEHLEKLSSGSLFHPTHCDTTAKIRVPTVMDFQLLSDMGRMNG